MTYRIALLSALLCARSFAGPVQYEAAPTPVASQDPLSRWELGFETAALGSIGNNASPLNYTLLPQWFEIKTPAHFHLDVGPGQIVVRSRFITEIAPIIEGPESYFIGLMLSPSVEWWNDSRTWAGFVSSGGGVGWMDAQGYEIEGAQGQDFNFTWFAQAGVIHRLSDTLTLSVSALFQHISNGGTNDINPGIDSLGGALGLSWSF